MVFPRFRVAMAVLGLSSLALAVPAGGQQQPAASSLAQLSTGREIFLAGCATCHGGDGRGTDRALVGFEEGLPDFTDCSFASREPAGDWVIVAHQGGPVRGFSEMMPSFGEALSEEQLERVIEYVQDLCRDRSWPRGELNLPRAIVTEKAYPEDEWVLENEVEPEDQPAAAHTLIYEKRFGAKSQIELSLPYLYRREELAFGGEDWTGGFGDVSLGFKQVLIHGLDAGNILSAVLEAKAPTGDQVRGFGSGAWAFEGLLTFGQIIASNGFLQAQGGVERSTQTGAETELFASAVVGWSIAQHVYGRTWTPMLEFAVLREGDEGTFWDVLPQLHVTLNTRQHVMLTVGPSLPLTGEERSIGLHLNLLWDWFDGGLFDGW